MRPTCCGVIQRMLRQAIPWTVEDGFIPDRDTEPRPLGARAGHARVGAEHHAQRKPVRRRSGDRQRERDRTGTRRVERGGRPWPPDQASPVAGLAAASTVAPGKKNPSIRSARIRSTP